MSIQYVLYIHVSRILMKNLKNIKSIVLQRMLISMIVKTKIRLLFIFKICPGLHFKSDCGKEGQLLDWLDTEL